MRHQALFDHVMTSGLRDWLDSQATAREKAKRQNLQILMIGMGIAAAAAIAVMSFMPDQAEYGFVVGALIGGITWWVANLPVQAISQQIKVRANEELGAALGLRYHLSGTPGSDFELATRMGLLPSDPDQADYSDFWEGTFGLLQILLGLSLFACSLSFVLFYTFKHRYLREFIVIGITETIMIAGFAIYSF
jgi:hypothetical protein